TGDRPARSIQGTAITGRNARRPGRHPIGTGAPAVADADRIVLAASNHREDPSGVYVNRDLPSCRRVSRGCPAAVGRFCEPGAIVDSQTTVGGITIVRLPGESIMAEPTVDLVPHP